MAGQRGGVTRILKKLERNIENGNYYEAHQMYKTLSFRYISQERASDAIELLYNGASLLLSKDQQESGLDLSLLLVNTLTNEKIALENCIIEKLGNLHDKMSKENVERLNFMQLALIWTTGGKTDQRGDPRLHRLFAMTLWRKAIYDEAHHHFIHASDSGRDCAHMLIEFHLKKGYRSECDLFIANAVLQYLCLKNETSAMEVLKTYTTNHPSVEKGPPFVRPLLNFCWLLLLAVENQKFLAFSVLLKKYEPSIVRDASYKCYLDKIGQNYFNLPPPQRVPENSFIDSIMRMFTTEDDLSTLTHDDIE
ncbi:DgyrCDS12669 [Dimorphilus gyrociliatus]|uniref:DgyrCDS12669 n=1 Tax=Dimorphilus gyrociliatus TaxID=2664684 RepID=A0A7I8W821_9ANNE|nr:DgyrCDS12669 [Dimorphilus gyrociliatus]